MSVPLKVEYAGIRGPFTIVGYTNRIVLLREPCGRHLVLLGCSMAQGGAVETLLSVGKRAREIHKHA